MPRVIVMLKPGRSSEQHAAMVRGVTDVVSTALDTDPEDVTVVLAELYDHLVARGGNLESAPR